MRPPLNYNNWDADKVQGCLCDEGWEGMDCSLRSCPWGPDPLAAKKPKREKFVLQCQATSGFFSMFVFGHYSPPIPFDADPTYMQLALQSINGVGTVGISMPSSSDGTAKVCGTSYPVWTTFWFSNLVGQRPPIYVVNAAANTRMWPQGSVSLQLYSSTPILRMVTQYTLTCQACPLCSGKIYFTYGGSVSVPVNITAQNAKSAIPSAILGMYDFAENDWPDLQVNVSGVKNKICGTSSRTFQVNLFSSYGNVGSIGILDSSYYSISTSATISANLSWTSNLGNGTLYECSNQGYCDRYEYELILGFSF